MDKESVPSSRKRKKLLHTVQRMINDNSRIIDDRRSKFQLFGFKGTEKHIPGYGCTGAIRAIELKEGSRIVEQEGTVIWGKALADYQPNIVGQK